MCPMPLDRLRIVHSRTPAVEIQTSQLSAGIAVVTIAGRAYTEDNDKEALPWALKAAEAGHLWSWHIIGDIYWNRISLSSGVSISIRSAPRTAAALPREIA